MISYAELIRDQNWQERKFQMQLHGYDVPDDATPESMQNDGEVYSEKWAWHRSKELNQEING